MQWRKTHIMWKALTPQWTYSKIKELHLEIKHVGQGTFSRVSLEWKCGQRIYICMESSMTKYTKEHKGEEKLQVDNIYM
jgi:hypothetical protein